MIRLIAVVTAVGFGIYCMVPNPFQPKPIQAPAPLYFLHIAPSPYQFRRDGTLRCDIPEAACTWIEMKA